MLSGKGKVWKANSQVRAHVIYIPADITKDSLYPFKEKETVTIRVDPENNCLIVEKRDKNG